MYNLTLIFGDKWNEKRTWMSSKKFNSRTSQSSFPGSRTKACWPWLFEWGKHGYFHSMFILDCLSTYQQDAPSKRLREGRRLAVTRLFPNVIISLFLEYGQPQPSSMNTGVVDTTLERGNRLRGRTTITSYMMKMNVWTFSNGIWFDRLIH